MFLCEFMHMCVCLGTCQGQKRALGVLSHSGYSFEAGPIPEPGVHILARLEASMVLLPSLPTLTCSLCVCGKAPLAGPYDCREAPLTTEPSLPPPSFLA